MDNVLFIQFIDWWTLDCFHLLAIVNNTAMNMGVQISPREPAFFLNFIIIFFLIYIQIS